MAEEWWREQLDGRGVVGLPYRAAVLYTASLLHERYDFESFVNEKLAACDVAPASASGRLMPSFADAEKRRSGSGRFMVVSPLIDSLAV